MTHINFILIRPLSASLVPPTEVCSGCFALICLNVCLVSGEEAEGL